MCPGHFPELPTQDQINQTGGSLWYRQREADEHELIAIDDRLRPSEKRFAEVITVRILGYIAAMLYLAVLPMKFGMTCKESLAGV